MTFQRRLWFLSLAVLALMALFSLRVLYWQMLRSRDLQAVALDPLSAAAEYARRGENPGDAIPDEQGHLENLASLPQPVLQRTIALLQTITRGTIYDRSGQLLAYDQVDEQGSRYRVYNDPTLAHVIGYTSAIRTGLTGLERSYNETLLGVNRLDAQLAMSLHQPVRGSDLILTIDEPLQQAAAAQLGAQPGAIVILDGSDGAVLAMVSYPRFDPNLILTEGYAAGLTANCGGAPSCQAPFLNRATQSLYTPGSTFKTVTLIAALDSGLVRPETMFDFGEPVVTDQGQYYVYRVGGGEIPDPNHKEPRLNLPMAYAKSANAAFARMGHEMNPDTFIRYAQRFGFSAPEGQNFPIEVEFTPARLANDLESIRQNDLLRAATAIGQGELQASPLSMALTALAVVNDGNLPIPYFVHAVQGPEGEPSERLPNRQVRRGLMSARTAQEARSMMITTVREGGGYRAAVEGLTVGGKTGTAQQGGDLAPHAWFVGFAERGEGAERRVVVMAILLENGGEGSRAAAPIFAALAPAAIEAASEAGGGWPFGLLNAQPDNAPAPIATSTVPPAPLPTETPLPVLTEAPPQPTLAPTFTAAPPPDPGPLPIVTLSSLPAPDIPFDPSKKDFIAEQASCPFSDNLPVASGGFIWPSPYQALSGGDFTPEHPGLDLSAPEGSQVYAADAGVVIFAGYTGVGYGNTVVVDHRNGYRTLYAHLSHISVHCGEAVSAGKIVGQSGSTGNSTGPHLHFEVRVPEGYLNPLRVLPTP